MFFYFFFISLIIMFFFTLKKYSNKIFDLKNLNLEPIIKPNNSNPTLKNQYSRSFTIENNVIENNIINKYGSQSFLYNLKNFNDKLNKEYKNIVKNITPDQNKTLNNYKKEIESVSKKFNKIIEQKADNNNLNPEIFINLSKELSLIKPPIHFYETHLEIIKIYLTIGLALKESQKLNNPIEKIILYNIIRNNINKINLN